MVYIKLAIRKFTRIETYAKGLKSINPWFGWCSQLMYSQKNSKNEIFFVIFANSKSINNKSIRTCIVNASMTQVIIYFMIYRRFFASSSSSSHSFHEKRFKQNMSTELNTFHVLFNIIARVLFIVLFDLLVW